MTGQHPSEPPALDSDDFRDDHERAMRDHILGAPAPGWPDTHICDDLCSSSIIDRLLGRPPVHEYPLQSHGAGTQRDRLRSAPSEAHDIIEAITLLVADSDDSLPLTDLMPPELVERMDAFLFDWEKAKRAAPSDPTQEVPE